MGFVHVIGLSGIIGLSTLTIAFVAADRLSQTLVALPPTTFVAKLTIASPEPEATGTVMQSSEDPDSKPARPMSGFDTEHLRDLMRGERPPLPPKKH